ncbi:MAG: glycosyltransferase family 4 protein, partial [Trueperaceae bacterium]
MRIALVSQEYPPETAHGGIASQTYLKAHGLASLGHEVQVISHSSDGSVQRSRDGGVQLIRVPGFDDELPIHTEPVRWLTYSSRVAGAVAELHAHSPLDLVEFPEWGCEGYVHLLNQTEWNHIPTVIQLHGPLVMLAHTVGWPEPDSLFYRIGTEMEGACLRLADAIFSSSRCSADWCVRSYGLSAEDIPVLHTGVDTDLFRPLEVPKAERPTIVFVGKLVANKGVEILLEAALQLTDDFPDLHLRMLGTGEEGIEERLLGRALKAGFSQLLELPGFVGREALPEHLSKAHVFAAPSVYEGGPGFVYLEAMACGLPVI